jgi:hypothetical protein
MPRGNISLKGEWAAIPRSSATVLYVRGVRDGETIEQIQAEKAVNGNVSDGSSWANASLNLQDVMDNKWSAGMEIWISAGGVKPDWATIRDAALIDRPGWASGLSGTQLADRRNWAFVLKEGVKIYGGFEGTETEWPPGLPQNKTVLSGDLGTEGNARHVLIATSITGETVVESLTVSAGVCTSGGTIPVGGKTITGISGGGVYTVDCTRNLKFINVTISNNTAADGGGMYNDQSSPTLKAVTISGNTATGYGGGIYNKGGGSPLLTGGTSISGNEALQGGGGICNKNASLVLEEVLVSRNSSKTGTGGIENNDKAVFTGTDVEITGNWSLEDGTGGVSNNNSTFTGERIEISGNWSLGSGTGGVSNNNSNFTGKYIVISDNRSGTGTGGMMNTDSHVSLTNARITGNETGNAAANAGGICNICSSLNNNAGVSNNYYVSLTNVEISGNKSAGAAGGIYTKWVYVTLTNVTISGNEAGTSGGGGIFLYSGQRLLKIQNSIIWGNGPAARNVMWNGSPPSQYVMRYDNTLVERPDGYGESGIVSGIYNAGVSEPFSGSVDHIFAGPLPSQAPATATLGAYQLKPGSIGIDKGNNTLYDTAVYDLSGVSPGDPASTPPLRPGPLTDFAGANRPQGVAIDLGAYENQ